MIIVAIIIIALIAGGCGKKMPVAPVDSPPDTTVSKRSGDSSKRRLHSFLKAHRMSLRGVTDEK